MATNTSKGNMMITARYTVPVLKISALTTGGNWTQQLFQLCMQHPILYNTRYSIAMQCQIFKITSHFYLSFFTLIFQTFPKSSYLATLWDWVSATVIQPFLNIDTTYSENNLVWQTLKEHSKCLYTHCLYVFLYSAWL